MKKLSLVCLLLLQTFIYVNAVERWTQYASKTLSKTLIDNKVYDITADKNGVMWFCTASGISSFDGVNWQSYPTDATNGFDASTRMTVDSKNNKWFATATGVFMFDGSNWTQKLVTPNPYEKAIFAAPLDTIYVANGSGGGVQIYDGSVWTSCQTSGTRGTARVYDFALDVNNVVWAITSSDFFKRSGNKMIQAYYNQIFYGENIAIDSKNNKWIVGNNYYTTLYKYNNTTTTAITVGSYATSDVAVDKSDNIWVGTDGGVSKYNGSTFTTYTKTNGLLSNSVNCVYVDANNVVWMGTDAGISCYNGTAWTNYTTDCILSTNMIQSIVVDANNVKWIGTDNGLIRFDDVTWKKYTTIDGLSSNSIKFVVVDKDTNIWCGNNYGNKLTKIYKNTVSNITYGSSLTNVRLDKQGNFWIVEGKGSNSISKYDAGSWTKSTIPSTITAYGLKHLAFDSNNSAWCVDGYDNSNIFNYKNNIWTTRAVSISGSVTDIAIDKNDNIWICDGNGIIKYDGTTSSWLYPTGSISSYYYAVAVDQQNTIWIGADNALYKFDGAAWYTYTNIKSAVNKIYVDAQNIKWICTSDGLYKLEDTDVDKDYQIRGTLYFDQNKNGVMDANDCPAVNQKVQLLPNGIITATLADGSYRFPVVKGDYQIKIIPQTPFTAGTDAVDYALTIKKDTTLAKVGLYAPATHNFSSYLYAPWRRCNSEQNLNIGFYSNGVADSYTLLRVTLDKRVGFVSCSPKIDSTDAQGRLYIKYPNVGYNASGAATMRVLLPGGTTDSIPYSCEILYKNQVVSQRSTKTIISCSYDPNDISVEPEGVTAKHYVAMKQDLRYVIHFQNTGNDTAYDVSIIDTLSSQLDPSTLTLEASSHPVRYYLKNGVIHFMFENIKLVDSIKNEALSHGFVSFTISPKSGTASGTVAENTAYIYFDKNAAVKTNTVFNTYLDQYSFLGQTIPLNEGWNLISFYVQPADSSLEWVFRKCLNNIEVIKTETDYYSTTNHAAFNTLQTISGGRAYLVKAKKETALNVSGQLVLKPFKHRLQKGWNMVGCPNNANIDFETKLDALPVNSVKNFEGYWKLNDSFNSIHGFSPGDGYYIEAVSNEQIAW